MSYKLWVTLETWSIFTFKPWEIINPNVTNNIQFIHLNTLRKSWLPAWFKVLRLIGVCIRSSDNTLSYIFLCLYTTKKKLIFSQSSMPMTRTQAQSEETTGPVKRMSLALVFRVIAAWPTGLGSLILKCIYMQNEGVGQGWAGFLPALIPLNYIMGILMCIVTIFYWEFVRIA